MERRPMRARLPPGPLVSILLLNLLFLATHASARPLDQSIPVSKSILRRYPISLAKDTSLLELERYFPSPLVTRQGGGYWYESAEHGISPFGPAGYRVFRNVKDFGAVGDGVTDDTNAINAAIQAGGRCGEGCGSSSVTPAVVYFPSGTYLVSKPLDQYYWTQFVGNPNAVPTLKAAVGFKGIGVISSNTYIPGGNGAEWYVPQSNFHRQVRNFIIDISACPDATPDGFAPTGIHWQVAQATSLQNIRFVMREGSKHVGIFMENGSGGYLGDLIFQGGAIGMWCGSQQFTARNLVFQNCIQAIQMIWDWGWTWHNLNIFHCQIGINVTALTSSTAEHNQGVAALAVLDSVFTNVPIAILTSGTTNTMLENVRLNNVPIAIGYSGGPTVLQGGDVLIDNYGNGNTFTQDGGKQTFNFLNGAFTPSAKSRAPGSLRTSSGWFARSKPQYESLPIGSFVNVKSAGARGDGQGDDADAINSALAGAAGRVVYFPHGVYRVSKTVNVPAGTKMVGEAWAQIMGYGPTFSDISRPQVVVRVGAVGSSGIMEISDMVFTVQGATAGAIVVEWNVHESSQGSAAIWDAHVRVGGAKGTHLQYNDCPWSEAVVNTNCIAATLLFHITSRASAYMENVWIWTADHDLDIPSQAQVSIYTARAFLVESKGPVWLWATAPEHSTLYQYRFYHAENVFGATLQTETPYYQPQPKAPEPFTGAYALPDDPTFTYCSPGSATCAYAWGMEVIGSSNLMFYGAGFYSWFQWYNQACLKLEACQERLVRVVDSTNIFIGNLYTKGTISMIQGNSDSDVWALRNMDGFLGTIVGWSGFNVGGVVDQPDDVVHLPPWIWDVPNPTVSCHIPCKIQPPPTPLPPIKPPVYTTTIAGVGPVTVDPPVIETPMISVQPVSVNIPGTQVVTAVIAPSPTIDVPPIIAVGGNFPGGPPNIKPPFIPIPIPPGWLPVCLIFCVPGSFPPILPPITVVEGAPLPVGLPPPLAAAGDPDDPDDDGPDGPNCPQLLPALPSAYPQPSDVPNRATNPPTDPNGGDASNTCGWAGLTRSTRVIDIAVGAGQSSFTANLFDLIGFGASSYTMAGATFQVYSTSVTSWTVGFQPATGTVVTSSNFWVNFDLPGGPPSTVISITGQTGGGVRTISLNVEIRASQSCGGTPIPNPPGSGSGGGASALPIIFPTKFNQIDCADGSNGGGVSSMRDCLWTYGSIIVQNQVLSETSTITTDNPDVNCIRHGVTRTPGGVETNFWCIIYQRNGCAFVISDKHTKFGSSFPGNSVISGQVMRNFVITAANQCAGNQRTAIAIGPFQPFGAAAHSLCLTHPDHPEICGVN